MSFTKGYIGNIKQNWEHVKGTFHFISTCGTTIDKLFYITLFVLGMIVVIPIVLLVIEPLERE